MNNQSTPYFKNIQLVEDSDLTTKEAALLGMEQQLFSHNISAAKLTQLKLFKLNEEDISALQKDTITTEILCDFGRFLHQYSIIDTTQLEECMADFGDYGTEYFHNYYSNSDTFERQMIERTLQRSAFGGSFFEEFDYKDPNGEQAQALKESYGSFPNYAIEDIDKRNTLITEIVNLFKAKVDESTQKHTGITCRYGSALSDTSNSDWLVTVYIENSYLFLYNSFTTI